jgi:hypothetical protein
MYVSMILESISMHAPPIKRAMRRSLGLLLCLFSRIAARSIQGGVALDPLETTRPSSLLRVQVFRGIVYEARGLSKGAGRGGDDNSMRRTSADRHHVVLPALANLNPAAGLLWAAAADPR